MSARKGGGRGGGAQLTERSVPKVGQSPLGPPLVRVRHLDGSERVDGRLGFDAVTLVDLGLAIGARGRGAGGCSLGPGASCGVEGAVVDLFAKEEEGADLRFLSVADWGLN